MVVVSSLLRLLATFLLVFLASATNEKGVAYLKENKEKEGVIELPSGLQYKALQSGKGSFHPTIDSPCLCHYAGTLIDGTEFDSSYSRGSPTTFAPNQVIKGWTEAMQLMVEGDKWELYIPSDLAYGPSGSPPKIGPDEALVFTIEMIEIKGDKSPAMRCDPVSLDGCNERQIQFVEKAKTKYVGLDALMKEKNRLEKMDASSMKEELRSWKDQRIFILEKMIKNSDESEL